MKRRLIVTPDADRDLLRIANHISIDSPRAAALFVRNIRRRIDGLRDFPEQGRRHDDLAADVRTFAFDRRVVIAYRVDEDAIQVLRVFYGGRDIESLMREGDDD